MKVDRRSYVKYTGVGFVAVAGAAAGAYYATKEEVVEDLPGNKCMLPLPKFTSGVVIEEAIAWRRSLREYKDEPIAIDHLSMLLWAAQGINELSYRLRTVPSAGATYPLEVYAVVAEKGVTTNRTNYLPAGSYKYNYRNHSIDLIKSGDLRGELAKASLDQEWVKKASVNIVVCAIYERTTRRYGERGHRYVHMEDGHVGQNIYLMAAALNLGTVVIGAFHDEQVRDIIGSEINENPLYVIPIGIPKEPYRIGEKEVSEYYERVRRSE